MRKLDATLESIGGFSRFQCFVQASMSVGMSSIGLILYTFGFNTQEPDYLCTYSTDSDAAWTECGREDFCGDDSTVVSWEIDWASDRSLNNWYGKLDLYCAPKWKTAAIMSIFFAGWTLTLPFLPRLADVRGRRPIWRVAVAVQFLMMLVVLWTRRVEVMLVAMFILGGLSSIRICVGYNYLIEFMPLRL